MASIDPEDRANALKFLEWIGQAFEQAGLEAVLIGGQARNFWTEPRATMDFDFTVAADATAFRRLLETLSAQGFRTLRDQGPHQPSGPDFVQMVNTASGEAIDLQAAKTDFQATLIERGVRLDPGQQLRVATVEDLLVLKLIANRKKDQNDLIDLALLDGIDWSYVEHWARVWGVSELLANLREIAEQERLRADDLYR
ncbi:MAG: hypothetical protein C0506_01520 [Anaerolinea sp.]|nr:hypothetical protein [Anaerolinea sp.]